MPNGVMTSAELSRRGQMLQAVYAIGLSATGLTTASSTVQDAPAPSASGSTMTFSVGTGQGASYVPNKDTVVGTAVGILTARSGDSLTVTVTGTAIAPTAGQIVTQAYAGSKRGMMPIAGELQKVGFPYFVAMAPDPAGGVAGDGTGPTNPIPREIGLYSPASEFAVYILFPFDPANETMMVDTALDALSKIENAFVLNYTLNLTAWQTLISEPRIGIVHIGNARNLFEITNSQPFFAAMLSVVAFEGLNTTP